MTGPTLEEMKPKNYIRISSPAIKAVRWSGSNWDDVHAVYPTLCEEYMRDRGCQTGDWVMSPSLGCVGFMHHDSFTKLYIVSEPAPESEDEAFERWWNEYTRPSGEMEHHKAKAKAAWHARARLSAGGK